jgi:hypothetical protein
LQLPLQTHDWQDPKLFQITAYVRGEILTYSNAKIDELDWFVGDYCVQHYQLHDSLMQLAPYSIDTSVGLLDTRIDIYNNQH